MRFPFLIPLLMLPVVAHASSINRSVGDTSLFIGEEVCKWAETNAPVEDAAYEGGVDVEGKPVAPASMAAQREQALADRLLRKITIEITSDLAVQLGMPEKLIRQRLMVGTVEVDDENNLTVNGEPLVNPDPAAWVEACEQSKNP